MHGERVSAVMGDLQQYHLFHGSLGARFPWKPGSPQLSGSPEDLVWRLPATRAGSCTLMCQAQIGAPVSVSRMLHFPGAQRFWSVPPLPAVQVRGRLHAFVAGAGTGGTIAGVSRYLKSRDPRIRVRYLCAAALSGITGKRSLVCLRRTSCSMVRVGPETP